MSAFRKRPPISYSIGSSVVDVSENEDGRRSLVSMSVGEYFRKNPVSMEEYSLTEELKAGVSLKEIPCSNLISSSDPIDHPIDENAVLEKVKKELNPKTKE